MTTSLSHLLFKKSLFYKKFYVFICTVYSIWPLLFPQYCLGESVFKNMFSPDRLNKGVFLNLAQYIFRRFF